MSFARVGVLRYITTIAVCAILLLCSIPVYAQFAFTVSQSGPVGPGGTVNFTTNMTNSGNSDFSLNDISFNFASPGDIYLSKNDDPFYDGTVPDSLAPVTSAPANTYAGPLFSITTTPNTPIGNYQGSVTITGSPSGGTDYDTIQPFQVIVTPTAAPEPSSLTSMSLLILSLVGTICLRGRRRRNIRA